MMVWVNEFHYDDASGDQGEFIEIAGAAGTDLTGWRIVLYNGSGGVVYPTGSTGLALRGIIPDQQNGFGTLSFAYPVNGLQNGSPDGFALVDPAGNVVEFLSYEGIITATNGPAAGLRSVDVGVFEPGTVEGSSIARTGSGNEAGAFTWVVDADDSPGAPNNGQTFAGNQPTLSVSDVSLVEGDDGTTNAVFTVTLSAAAATAVSVDFSTADDTATGGLDYAATAGTITFGAGETSKQVVVPVIGDVTIEGDEAFALLLSNAAGAVIADASGTATIISDDLPETFPGVFSVADQSVGEGTGGTTPITFTITRADGSDGAVSVDYAVAFNSADAGDFAAGSVFSGIVNFAAGQTEATISLAVEGDAAVEQAETFTIRLSNPSGGAGIGDGEALGTIRNDDVPPLNTGVFINELHYDNGGTDVGEAIEIAAPAGTDLTGWTLVLYSTSSGAAVANPYNTRKLAGTVADQDDGYGTLSISYPVNGIQNGPLDGVALVDPFGRVVQFLSYEGQITGGTGPAAGMVSQDIGVTEGGAAAGFSLQLTGSGASYADFSWAEARDDSFGAVNQGQDFVGRDATGLVSIGDAAVIEGDAGVQQMVFTVRRAGGLGQSATVDYAITTGTAAGDDLASGQPLTGTITFGEGVASVQIVVGIAGDTAGEPNESFTVSLANPAGNIAIADGSATGTIRNDDVLSLRIFDIQGEAHRSPYEGQPVTTSGIVTMIDRNGFYVQDPIGDGNGRTSDALFVFTGSAPVVALGDLVRIDGKVSEFLPQGRATNLTTTQISATSVVVESSGNALPAATVIGADGILPPTDTIDDDGFATFDPANDGIDFYESLEGMRVTVDAPLVIENSSAPAGQNVQDVQVVASLGEGVTGLNPRGGVTISDGDFNPERIRLFSRDLLTAPEGGFTQGDELSDATGILSYYGGGYELILTEAVTVTADAPIPVGEITGLTGDRNHLTIATYNVENLDPSDTKFDILAGDIVYDLKAPDIIGLQEIQDANGANGSDPLSGVVTAQLLIDAIKAIGGPDYVYIEVAPTTAGSSGGEPGGNIRNGFLYNADRVSYVAGSAVLLDDPAYAGTRKPLSADFTFNGETVRLINVHSSARIGSDPLFGANQPPENADEGRRIAQSQAVLDYVESSIATNPNLHFGVLGDFNAFYFEESLELLEESGVFTNLHRLNPEEERYSYVFDGNAQAIDHILVSGGLAGGAALDAVHINAEQPFGSARGTDHDPLVARIYIKAPNEAPADLALDDAAVAENAPAGTLVGTVSASDIDGDTLSYQLLDDGDGLFVLDGATGALTTTALLDFEGRSSYVIEALAVDPAGLKVVRSFTINVTDVNEAPVAAADAVAVDEDGTTGNLWSQLLGNDTDPDAGAQLSIESVDGEGLLGELVFDAASQRLVYIANHDSFDSLPAGTSVVDRFSYTVTDQNGLTSTATVSITVTGIADGVRLDGGNGSDTLAGTGGEDVLLGGNGDDVLRGLDGHDRLEGGNGSDTLLGGIGNDLLLGGNGNDLLVGGAGRDEFQFARGGGSDTIGDFELGIDRIVLGNGIGVKGHQVGDVDGDGIKDLSIAFTRGGGSVVLLGVTDLGGVDFVGASGFGGVNPDDLGYQANMPIY